MQSVIIVFGLAAALAALYFYNYQNKECFWNTGTRAVVKEVVFGEPRDGGFSFRQALPDSIREEIPKFYQTPQYQALLSPRFSNVDYGANLRTQLPAEDHLGVPSNPLAMAGLPPGDPSDVPIGLEKVTSKNGIITQPIIYNRYIYANKNSRLRGLGDPLRGDLPITPLSGDWFVPSAAKNGTPNLVLQQGALAIMGGESNNTGRKLASFLYQNSGGADKIIGGVEYKPVTNQAYQSINPLNGDLTITAFP